MSDWQNRDRPQDRHIARPGTGVLFWEPEDERKSEKSPDYKGHLLLDRDYKKGEKVKISAWRKQTSRGTDLISLSEDTGYKDWKDGKAAEREQVKNTPVEVKRGYAAPKQRQQGDYDDEVPFD